MADTPETSSLSSEVLQKIGRNVLSLQWMEAMLKEIVVLSQIDGSLGELPRKDHARRQSVAKKTMGQVVGEFFKQVCSEYEEPEGPREGKGPWMADAHKIEGSKEYIDGLQDAFATVVNERNHLIHHGLVGVDLHSQKVCEELIRDLDAHYDRIQRAKKFLRDEATSMVEMRRVLAQVLREEFLRGDGQS